MYDDIVASTEPNLYYQPSFSKPLEPAYPRSYFQSNYEMDSDVDMMGQNPMAPIQGQQNEPSECNGCRRNEEKEEDFGLESTFDSWYYFNKSQDEIDLEDNPLHEMEAYETFHFGNSMQMQNSHLGPHSETSSFFHQPKFQNSQYLNPEMQANSSFFNMTPPL